MSYLREMESAEDKSEIGFKHTTG